MDSVPIVFQFITTGNMAKQFLVLSSFVLLVPHLLICELANVDHAPVETTELHNETSTMSLPADDTRLKTTTAIPDEDPVTVAANLTKTSNSSGSVEEPMKILATVEATKLQEGKAPAISLVPPSFPGAPVGLVAHVPPHKPVQINADVPPGTHVKVQAEVDPDVPVVAVVVGHGTARFYSPWKKASSATRSMFNVNVK